MPLGQPGWDSSGCRPILWGDIGFDSHLFHVLKNVPLDLLIAVIFLVFGVGCVGAARTRRNKGGRRRR